jgi:hypothetical protein
MLVGVRREARVKRVVDPSRIDEFGTARDPFEVKVQARNHCQALVIVGRSSATDAV